MALSQLRIHLIILLQAMAIILNAQSEDLPIDHSFSNIMVLQPTGDTISGLPEMEKMDPTSKIFLSLIPVIDSSFIKEFIDIYMIAQHYLKNMGEIEEVEPAYIAITSNEGGFPRKGFALIDNEEKKLKKETYYIDISNSQALRDPSGLMTFTQLYPHEMGHVLLHLLCKEDSIGNNTKSVNMHFFNTITDYSTAFNEGFAEHIENVSRLNEKNEKIKLGIREDLTKIEKESPYFIQGFKKDFLIPSRLGYFKSSMIYWYQRYEDYIRYQWAMDGSVKKKNESLHTPNVKDIITFRNSGVSLNVDESKNLVQKHATEGVISSFFTHLTSSGLAENYLPNEFYKPFIEHTLIDTTRPEYKLTPLENQFIKYFHVLHNYVIFNQSTRSQLYDFVDGYIQSFPDEANVVRSIYEEVVGDSYDAHIPPPLWLMVEGYNHRMVVFDPFDAITIPVYTFDLNAAEVEDLMIIKGISKSDARTIIKFREENGFFNSLEDLENIQELTNADRSLIANSTFNQTKLEEIVENNYPSLTLKTFLIEPIKYLIVHSSFFFILIFSILFSTSFEKDSYSLKKSIFLAAKYYLLWLLFVFMGLISLLFSQFSTLVFILFGFFIFSFGFILFRKQPVARFRTVLASILMTLSIMPSII